MSTYIYVALVIVYSIILCVLLYKIIQNATTPSKALGYILLVILFPIIGIVIYLSVGLNYRKQKLYDKKIIVDNKAFPDLEKNIRAYSSELLRNRKSELNNYFSLANFQHDKSFPTDNNTVEVLLNGEQKFPEVLAALRNAKHHIHIEYYIYENDSIGSEIAEILMEKAAQGIEVRFIYDDFGSQKIRNSLAKKLQNSGVEAVPFYKISFIHFANRMNYRNHRKIIVIDGIVGFVGGINISDKYNNSHPNSLYWRDTHLKITGAAVLNLQYTFLTDWNFCTQQQIQFGSQYFDFQRLEQSFGTQLIHIVTSGPDSDYPNIMYSLMQALVLAKDYVYITTPYFIPDKSFLDAVKIASLSGVSVKLLVPEISDSWIVNTTSQSYYEELLEAGIQIYTYKKGFIHAKTMICDDQVSVVGTTNLDNRSFELNFEINAIVFDAKTTLELKNAFLNDIKDATELQLEHWKQRSKFKQFIEKVLQLFSSLM